MKLFLLGVLLGQAAASLMEDASTLNGSECLPHSQPWQAFLTDSRGNRCGGSLISELWVLSAFLCYTSSPNDTVVHLGENDLRQEEGTEQRLPVAMMIPHSPYKSPIHNVMLIKLAQPAQFNQYVQPIALPTRCPKPGEECVLSGWGPRSTDGDDHPHTLQCLGQTIVDDQTCRKAFPIDYSPYIFCAENMQGETNSFRGDSGGPLVCDGQLQGLVSLLYGQTQRGTPRPYSNVCKYIGWIQNIMRNH